MKLATPRLNYQTAEQVIDVFGGINNTLSAKANEFNSMKNMTSDNFPMASSRKSRELVRTLTTPNGMFSDGSKLCWVDGTKFYYDGVEKGTVANSKKSFVEINKFVLIFPDRAFYDTVGGTFGSFAPPKLTTSFEKLTVSSVNAKVITLVEAVTAAEATALVTKKIVIKSGVYTITAATATNGATKATITVAETLVNVVTNDTITPFGTPYIDHAVVYNNRVFGVQGQNIYASKQGDFKEWNVFAGLATDSWATDVAGYGNFKGITRYQNHVVMQTESTMFELYGYKPENFQVQETVKQGISAGTYAELNSTLYFANENGVFIYTGGLPRSITEDRLVADFKTAKAGTDGRKYYLSLADGLYIYDPEYDLWHKEESAVVVDFAYHGGFLYALLADGKMMKYGSGTEKVSFEATLAESFDDDYFKKKGIRKIEMYAEMGADSYMGVSVRDSSKNDFVTVGTFASETKKNLLVPIMINAEAYQIKISGYGTVKIRAIKKVILRGGKR